MFLLNQLPLLKLLCLVFFHWSSAQKLGNTPKQKFFFEKLLQNYDAFVQPGDNSSKPFVVNARCYARMAFRESSQSVIFKMLIVQYWKDKRLTWDSTATDAPSRIVGRGKPNSIWIPNLTGFRELGRFRYAIKKDGTVILMAAYEIKAQCILKDNKFPSDRYRCASYFVHDESFRYRCDKKPGLTCCFKKDIQSTQNTLWRLKPGSLFTHSSNSYGHTYTDIVVDYERNGAHNQFYFTPNVILGLMTALHCLVRRTSGGAATICVMIFATLIQQNIIHNVPVIRRGGGDRLVKMSACILMLNAVNIIWLSVAHIVQVAGGLQSSILTNLTVLADKYRLFLILPPVEEMKESDDSQTVCDWKYFSLILDRLLCLFCLLILIIFSASV